MTPPETAPFFQAYRPRAHAVDEVVTPEGAVKPHWADYLAALSRLGQPEAARRFQLAERHLRESGVFYRVYSDPQGLERDWPLSHAPLILTQADWAHLSAATAQRAQLVEAVLADAYGANALVAQGALPPGVIAANPDYLRPMAGANLRGGSHLYLYAADFGRGPDGRWWALHDRTDAPSGAGYAVENRLAMARAFPDFFRSLPIQRLSGFFQAMRQGIAEAAGPGQPRIGLLSPGPENETYFEHAYLARYLGFLLLEGGDLEVRNGAAYVRTVSGPQRLDAVMRRIDSTFCDSLELDAASGLGAPGLAEAVRAGAVLMANAIGAGLAEAPAMLAFYPGLAQRLLGQDLIAPNIATWWLGDARARAEALARFDELAFGPAFRPLMGAEPTQQVLGADVKGPARDQLIRRIEAQGAAFVAQEAVSLSTMPVWTKTDFRARPFMLRLFAARTPAGWAVLPGGFCRISASEDARAISMQQGSASADVWVLGERPEEGLSLLPRPEQVAVRRSDGALPARAADNLFWLGRYLERCEFTLRLIRALGVRLGESDFAQSAREARGRIAALLHLWGATKLDPREKPLAAILSDALRGAEPPASALRLGGEARRTASKNRDRLSPDAWRAIEDLAAELDVLRPLREAETVDIAERGLRTISAVSGLIEDNMNRLSGWRFLQLGRGIERALTTCRLARALADEAAPADCLDALLELGDTQITYRRRYVMGAFRVPVVDTVILDPGNPRSAAFQAERLLEHLKALVSNHTKPMMRRAYHLHEMLYEVDAQEIDISFLLRCEEDLMALSDDVGARFFGVGAQAPGEEAA